jgi:DUF4097 and DUF4098 domain-containing protein YvlB
MLSSNVRLQLPTSVPVEIKTVSGDVTVKNLAGGALSVSTASGNLDAESFMGKLVMQTASGDVEIDGFVSADFSIESASGDVEIEGLRFSSGAGRIVSQSGDITVRCVREACSFKYRLHSTGGDVTDPLGSSRERGELIGAVGDGKGVLEITTQGGDIEVG